MREEEREKGGGEKKAEVLITGEKGGGGRCLYLHEGKQSGSGVNYIRVEGGVVKGGKS